MESGKLEGMTALITGGSKGIGKAIAELFFDERANVAINFNSSETEALKIKERLKGAEIFKADVSNRVEVHQMIEKVFGHFGSLDIIVNNAGIMDLIPFEEYDDKRVNKMFDVNVKGPIFVTLESIKYLKLSRAPVIVNIASNAGIGTAIDGTTFYSMSKAAVIALTKRLAFDLRNYHIRVNAIAPGWVETDMTTGGKDRESVLRLEEFFKARTTLSTYGLPKNISTAALFLASSDSEYMNGQVLTIDGGRIDNLTHSI